MICYSCDDVKDRYADCHCVCVYIYVYVLLRKSQNFLHLNLTKHQVSNQTVWGTCLSLICLSMVVERIQFQSGVALP